MPLFLALIVSLAATFHVHHYFTQFLLLKFAIYRPKTYRLRLQTFDLEGAP